MIKFAERLRELRKERHVTQKDMGEILGIQLRSYQCYERAATAARTMRNWWPWRITST